MTVTLGKNEFSTQPPEVFDQGLRGVLKDEFFPVQICKQKKWLKVQDPTSTMIHGVVEQLPTFCVMEGRLQTEVNYDGKRPVTDTSTATAKKGEHSFGNGFIRQQVFV